MEYPNKRFDMSAGEIQQEYYESIGDADWELYEKKDRRFLLQKVAVALCGPPSNEGNLMDGVKSNNTELKLQGYDARDEDTCMKVFDKILEQAKYSHNGENLIISVLRVVCVIPSREIRFFETPPNYYWSDLHNKKGASVQILVFHVFSIRKCISMNPKVKGCKVFIDHDARVYDTWLGYLTENKLPKCVMVVPRNGEYTGTILDGEMPLVNLTLHDSPQLGPAAQVINVADNVSTVANVGALVAIVGAAFATPVVAPVMIATAVGVASVSGIYSIGRSIATLIDRAHHEQNIVLENMQGRSSWINIMISTVGLPFTTARNVKIPISALDFLKYTNLATGFIGVANGLGDMIYKFVKYRETPTTVEVFQFTTSALFLGIGVMSNQTAHEIVKDPQAIKINEIRDSLSSNNKRKISDKVNREIRRLWCTIDGNTDVIRPLRTIENKDDFFGKLKYMNKSFNKNKVRISLGPAKLTTKNAPTRINSSDQVAGYSKVSVKEICQISHEDIIKISAFIMHLSAADQDFIIDLQSHLCEVLHDGFLLVCTELTISLIHSELNFLNSIGPGWKRRLVFFVFQYLKSKITDDEKDSVFMAALKSDTRDCRINRETLLKLKKKVMDYFVKVKRDKYSPNRTWDEGDDNMCNYISGFNTLRVGQKVIVGPHTILVKQTSLNNFEKWFENYPQKKCDMFMQLCFKIIATLSKFEVRQLNAINPDEDIMMRVSLYLLDRFDDYITVMQTVDEFMILSSKTEIIKWCDRQRVREQYTCVKCEGITYCKKK